MSTPALTLSGPPPAKGINNMIQSSNTSSSQTMYFVLIIIFVLITLAIIIWILRKIWTPTDMIQSTPTINDTYPYGTMTA